MSYRQGNSDLFAPRLASAAQSIETATTKPATTTTTLTFRAPSNETIQAFTESGSVSVPTNVEVVAYKPWQGGINSLEAVAIGAAEGTRNQDGSKTAAYDAHTDPGNGAANKGNFSYQHLTPEQKFGKSPTEIAALADSLQLEKLKGFDKELQKQAQAKGITLTELQRLNGLDLCNQSEGACLNKWGYIDRLVQFGATDADILPARTWSYWDPEREAFDAPGLIPEAERGHNDVYWVEHDQHRRMEEIRSVLDNYQIPAETYNPDQKRLSDQLHVIPNPVEPIRRRTQYPQQPQVPKREHSAVVT